MKLTTKAQYAIVALNYMKAKHGLVCAKEISEKEGISLYYLEQLFRKLREAGLVVSQRGPGGGYTLAREEITYKQILEAVGEKVAFVDNLMPKSMATKATINNLAKVHLATMASFESLTI